MTKKLIIAACAILFSSLAQARITGTNPTGSSADAFCVGKTAAETCTDSAGNVIPTTDNTQNLGTSSLRWGDIRSNTLTTSGNQTSGIQIWTKSQVGTAATSLLGVTQSTIVPVGSSYISVLSSAPTTVVLTSLPNISTTTTVGGTTEITDGTFIVIRCTSTVSGVVFQDNGTLSGSQLELGSTSRTVTQFKTLSLIYDAVVHKWIEVAYGNN